MVQKQNFERKKEDERNFYDWLRVLAFALLFLGAGLFVVNQSLEFFYRSAFLQQPCALCMKLNPEVVVVPKINNVIGGQPIGFANVTYYNISLSKLP